jgi:hypothetical protein
MTDVLRIPAITKESVLGVVTTPNDPTGTLPQWALVTVDAQPAGPDWVNGSWATAHANGRVTTWSPTIGGVGSGATMERAAGRWRAWIKFTVGSQIPAEPLDVIEIY